MSLARSIFSASGRAQVGLQSLVYAHGQGLVYRLVMEKNEVDNKRLPAPHAQVLNPAILSASQRRNIHGCGSFLQASSLFPETVLVWIYD